LGTDGELIVVEVKTRRNEEFGKPEEAITDRKIRNIIISTDTYIKRFEIDLPVRFDIITVTGTEPPFHIEHIQEAFLPPVW
jgi:putative endonuclease